MMDQCTYRMVGQSTESRSAAMRLRLARIGSVRSVAIVAFFIGVVVMLFHRPFSQGEVGDTAIYDYIAQSVLRGQVPYRDVVDIKWPAAAHLSALAMLVGKQLGIRDLIAVRLLNIFLVGSLSALIFLVTETYFRSRKAAVIAFLLPLMLPRFADWMVAGTEPKLALIVFGMLSLLLLARDQPFWAGLFSMLACLSWQPGLMFTGVTVLIFSRYLTSWRDMRAIKAMVGAIIPLAVTVLYFALRGAFDDLWAWTITYNYSVFGPDANRGAITSLEHIWKVTRRIFEGDAVIVLLSVIGLFLFAVERIRAKLRDRQSLRSPDLFRDAILIPPIIYFGFCLFNFQAGPDLIPFIPFIGIFAAKFLLDAGRLVISHLRKARPSIVGRAALIPHLAMGLLLALVLGRASIYRMQGPALRDQDKAFRRISDLLGTDGKIYVHGTTEILVLLNKANLNPYVFLDWGADAFAASRRSVEFSALIDEMESQAPKIVALSRMKVVAHRGEFEKWVDDKYEELELEVPGYTGVYLRKQQ
jgi:uncharacterized membrane protein